MALALFDLDHTLVQADTPRLWFSYLIDKGILPEAETTKKAIRFTEDYRTGKLNYLEYMRFELFGLKNRSFEEVDDWRKDFQMNCLRPNISAKARALLDRHRQAGDTLVIITASNRFIAEPAAKELDVPNLIATDPEYQEQRYTGEHTGIACFREGKIEKLDQWIETNGLSRDGAHFYSDSANDLPLLEQVTYPIAVNPDEKLAAIARQRSWPTLDLVD